MSTNRFHKAAKDSLMRVLKEATTRDCNTRDEQGMTPTQYAAFHGHLDAVRLLCARGGDPDKADIFGTTSLHLSAAQGHKDVVTFLVNFGANIYATDVDGRTAQDLAAMNDRDDILRFLDDVHAKLETEDKKKTKALKDKAKKESDKRVKEFIKRQTKLEKIAENPEQQKMSKDHRLSISIIKSMKTGMRRGSMSNLINPSSPPPRFSTIVGSGTNSGNKNISMLQKKIRSNRTSQVISDEFKIREIKDGRHSIRSLTGYRRDSEVLYTGTITSIDPKERERLDSVFTEADDVESISPPVSPRYILTRSISQPDFLHEIKETIEEEIQQEPSGIFVRPGVGSIAFRKSITNTLQGYYGSNSISEEILHDSYKTSDPNTIPSKDELSETESSDDENPNEPLELFLRAWGLRKYLPRFEEHKIDLDTLLTLTEKDIESLNLSAEHHKKLVTAVNQRKSALENIL